MQILELLNELNKTENGVVIVSGSTKFADTVADDMVQKAKGILKESQAVFLVNSNDNVGVVKDQARAVFKQYGDLNVLRQSLK